MRFIHSDLGRRSRGDVVEVTLSGAANVRLMDSSNFNSYRRGGRHRCQGGLVRRSPFQMTIPSGGRWHVTVDTQGLKNTARAGVRVLDSAALRPLSPAKGHREPLRAIADNIAEAVPDHVSEHRKFDVFICHASDDKDDIVRPLVHALQERGLNVWYDEFVLRVGDSLRRRIDEGIRDSRFGLVVFSGAFFAKGWPQHELDGLVTMSVTGHQVLLPIWHKVTKEEILGASPSLADKVALRTVDYGVDEIADEVRAVILGD